MNTPSKIIAAGDWHGNGRWGCHVISRVPELLPDEDFRLIIQFGDFGIWPGLKGRKYLSAISDALDRAQARLWFFDGNHECFPLLANLRDAARVQDDQLAPVDARGLIWHMPRGFRWEWHGRRWLAVGGGVSLDRKRRVEPYNWWPEEEITAEQARRIAGGGPADVMLCHDIPSSVMAPLRPELGEPPSWWAQADFRREEQCQERLQQIADGVRPSHLFHGHMHRVYRRMVRMGHGSVDVRGLDMDGDDANYGVLDLATLEWIPVPPAGRGDLQGRCGTSS